MKDKIKNATNTVTAHVSHYRVPYAVIATMILMHKLDGHRVQQWNEFLAEKGLSAEFYNPEAYLETLTPSY